MQEGDVDSSPIDLDARPPSCGETAEQSERNGIEWRRAMDAGLSVYWREVMVADDNGDLRRCRYQETVIEGEARFDRPQWTQAKITDDGRVFTRARGDHPWRLRRSGRAPRPATNRHTRGSRRRVESSSQASRDGPSDPDEPPGLATASAGCSVAGADDCATGKLADRIAATLDGAGNHPRSGFPEGFTYRELATIVYTLGESEPSRAQLSAVRRSVARLVEDGRAEREAERRLGERGAVEVRRHMTAEDRALREIAIRPWRQRIEAHRRATPYPIDTGYGGIVEVPVEPVLVIGETRVALRGAS